MNTIKNAYIRDNVRCLTPVYAPAEQYSFYINFDDPTNDPGFGNFRLHLYRGSTVIASNIGLLQAHVVVGINLYNIYCEFEFPDVPNGQYQFVIVDSVSHIEKCRSNVILCERDYFQPISQTFVFWDEQTQFNYYYELLPGFKNRFRLPLAMINYQYETTRTQYRNVSDSKLRNLHSYLDKIVTIESYSFDEQGHDAITCAYEHRHVFIQNSGITPKTAYTVTTNQQSTLTKGAIDVYLNGDTLDEFGDDNLFDTIVDAGDAFSTRDIIIDSNF